MSSPPPSTWADRRALFQKGKEMHEPGRRLSNPFGTSDAPRRLSATSLTKDEAAPPSPPVSGSGRRRSSAASNGLFGNLNTMKRGSQDYGERKSSFSDQAKQGGLVSGWWNSTMRGHQQQQQQQQGAGGAAAGAAQQQQPMQQQQQQKRGVME